MTPAKLPLNTDLTLAYHPFESLWSAWCTLCAAHRDAPIHQADHPHHHEHTRQDTCEPSS